MPLQVDNNSMDRTPTTGQKFLAEMLGTSFLTWIGAGSITAAVFLLNGAKPPLAFSMADLGMIALAFAFAIAAMVYTIGHISGCHINPAVTFAFAVTRRISWGEAAVYLDCADYWRHSGRACYCGQLWLDESGDDWPGSDGLWQRDLPVRHGRWLDRCLLDGDDWHLFSAAGHHGNGSGWPRARRLGRLNYWLDGCR